MRKQDERVEGLKNLITSALEADEEEIESISSDIARDSINWIRRIVRSERGGSL